MNHQPAVGDGRVRGWLSLISHSQADFSLPGCLSGGGGVVGVLAVSGCDAKLGVLPLQTRARPMSCATASLTLTPTHRSRHTCVHKHRQACTHSHACTCARARAHARARTHTHFCLAQLQPQELDLDCFLAPKLQGLNPCSIFSPEANQSLTGSCFSGREGSKVARRQESWQEARPGFAGERFCTPQNACLTGRGLSRQSHDFGAKITPRRILRP